MTQRSYSTILIYLMVCVYLYMPSGYAFSQEKTKKTDVVGTRCSAIQKAREEKCKQYGAYKKQLEASKTAKKGSQSLQPFTDKDILPKEITRITGTAPATPDTKKKPGTVSHFTCTDDGKVAPKETLHMLRFQTGANDSITSTEQCLEDGQLQKMVKNPACTTSKKNGCKKGVAIISGTPSVEGLTMLKKEKCFGTAPVQGNFSTKGANRYYMCAEKADLFAYKTNPKYAPYIREMKEVDRRRELVSQYDSNPSGVTPAEAQQLLHDYAELYEKRFDNIESQYALNKEQLSQQVREEIRGTPEFETATRRLEADLTRATERGWIGTEVHIRAQLCSRGQPAYCTIR